MTSGQGWIAELGLGRPAAWPTMGVRADDRRWPEPADPDRLELRRHLAAEHPDCIAALPGSEAAVGDVAALAGTEPTGGLAAVAVAQGDDVCLLDPVRGWPLIAGAVLFPSHWHLADKLGRPVVEIHTRVPDYPAGQVDRFLDRLRPGQLAWRRNLLVHRDGELHAPVARTDDVPVDQWWLRSERQTFRLLPGSGAVLFTIRTDTAPLAALDGDTRVALADRLAAMPPTWAPYAGVGHHLSELVAHLRS